MRSNLKKVCIIAMCLLIVSSSAVLAAEVEGQSPYVGEQPAEFADVNDADSTGRQRPSNLPLYIIVGILFIGGFVRTRLKDRKK